MSNNQTRQSLNPTRTPEEKATFKAKNLAQPKKVVTIELPKSQEFKIVWETPVGSIGWTQIEADSVEEAMEFFFTLRGKKVPQDAIINVARRV